MKIADNIIVVEGTDGVGKSTLAASLAKDLGYQHKWMGRPEKGTAFEFYLSTYLDELQQDVVMDRAHFSEEVYGEYFRGGSEFTRTQNELFNHLLRHCASTVLVHCVLPRATILDNQGQNPDDEHHGSDPDKIQALYHTVLNKCGMPVLRYNYQVETPEELTIRIINASNIR